MNTRKNAIAFFAVIFTVSFTIAGWAALAWAGNAELSLMPDKSHKSAEGTLSVSENKLSIEAEGLHPNSVYTVWFVNMKPKKQEVGVGESPYMFKTDAEGKGRYTSALNESPFGKWGTLMIVLHTTGDPTNMKDMVPALTAEIPGSN